MPQSLLVVVCFGFVDGELLAIPSHRDVVERALYVTCVGELVVALHAVQASRPTR